MDQTDRRFRGWGLIAVAALVMGAAGVYQFGWSSIRLPLGARLGVPEPALGTVFTLFVVFQTVSQFPAGLVRDRIGPRIPLIGAAGCLFVGLVGVAIADSFPVVLLAYAAGGIGVAISYTVAINTAVKWFNHRRGLATSVVAASYPGVSFILIPALRTGVTGDFAGTVLILGAAVGGTALLAAAVLHDPPGVKSGGGAFTAGDEPAVGTEEPPAGGDERAWRWREVVRTWQFWLLYAVFVVVNGVGLMVIGKVVSFAAAMDLPATAGTAAASAIALSEAGGVLVVGGLSDRFSRRRVGAASLVLCGVSLAGAVGVGAAGIPAAFVVLIGATAFFRGPPFGVFPTIIGEYYGRTYSSENYAALYTAKLFGGVFGGTGASALVVAIGWSASFAIAAGLVAVAGVALTFLRPVSPGDRIVA
jgi:OFA family oxalate/formate antiporter-like MFS transporter